MSTRKSITPGDVFGRLTVLSEAPRREGYRYWLCQCSCGSPIKKIDQSHLNTAKTKSCGCLRKEISTKTIEQTRGLNKTHGLSTTPEYKIWHGMWQRCTNPDRINYQNYKNRTPPDAWKDFEVFLADMGPKPTPKHSIERVDNDKSYGPDNCLWATPKEQSRNKLTNVNITYQGRTQCLASWSEEFNLKQGVLRSRLARGWPIEKALTTKVGI